MSAIFIQIASYRDPELLSTIRHCLDRAAYPENLTFGICYQDENFSRAFDWDSRFQIIKVPYQESKGACWARSKTNELYKGETFTLQIDSHMRFIQDWDKELIAMWKDLKDDKAVLTTYPAEYLPDQKEEEWKTEPHVIHTHSFKDGQTQQRPRTLPDWRERTTPFKAIHVAAGFIFGPGKIIEDVPYDPEFYFSGEETALAVRLYTHGYNLFHPHKIILWHYYGREPHPKNWTDNKEWGKIARVADERLECLLKRSNSHNLGKYTLGNVRTLEDFQNYSGIDYNRKILHLDTADGKEPPVDTLNKSKWTYETRTYKCKMKWDYTKIDKCDDPRFWAFIFKDQNDQELYRKDVIYSAQKDLLDGKITEAEFEFEHFWPTQIPTIFLIWPYSESKHWLNSTACTIQ